jgi:prevent-host-death family protein
MKKPTTIGAAEFKARCLKLIDEVHDTGRPLTITKRGRIVATLQPAGDDDEKPWLKLRGRGKYSYKDPFKPAVDPSDWDAIK